MEEFEGLGKWWLPNEPDRFVGGTLRFTVENGLTLQLVGQLGLAAEDDEIDDRHQVILGHADELGLVTLVGCWIRRRDSRESHGFGPLLVTEYGASTGFIGALLELPASRRFDQVQVEYSHLFDWLGISGLKHGSDEQSDNTIHQTWAYQEPDELVLQLSALVTPSQVELRFVPGFSESLGWEHVSLRQTYRAVFRSPKPWSVRQWLREAVSPIQYFLTFATGVPNGISGFTFCIPDTPEGWPDHAVRVVWNSYQHAAEERPTRYEMPLSFDDIRDRLPDVLNTWIELTRSIDSVIELVMLMQYKEGKFPMFEAEFLNVVQALESYHRRRRPGEDLARGDFEKLWNRIKSSVQPADFGWIARKLPFPNEKSLHTRLEELINETDLVANNLLDDPDSFIRSVKWTRNYFTHFDPNLERKRLQLPELVDAVTVLKQMLKILLLQELGLSLNEAHRKAGSYFVARRLGLATIVADE